jgi:hypothetical protein
MGLVFVAPTTLTQLCFFVFIFKAGYAADKQHYTYCGFSIKSRFRYLVRENGEMETVSKLKKLCSRSYIESESQREKNTI